MWVRRFSIEASTGGVWRSIAPLQCRNDIEPGPPSTPNAAAPQAPGTRIAAATGEGSSDEAQVVGVVGRCGNRRRLVVGGGARLERTSPRLTAPRLSA